MTLKERIVYLLYDIIQQYKPIDKRFEYFKNKKIHHFEDGVYFAYYDSDGDERVIVVSDNKVHDLTKFLNNFAIPSFTKMTYEDFEVFKMSSMMDKNNFTK